MTFIDPPQPPEAGEGGLRAKELKNRVVVLRKTGTGIDESRPDSKGRPWEWTEADTWVIDRSGIEHFEPGLRISWWRVRGQLNEAGNNYIAGRVVEQEDNSIILAPLSGSDRDKAARKVVESVMDEILNWGGSMEAEDSEAPF